MPSREVVPPINSATNNVSRVARFTESGRETPDFYELKAKGLPLPVNPYNYDGTLFLGKVVKRGSIFRNCFSGHTSGSQTLLGVAQWLGGVMFYDDVLSPKRRAVRNALFREILDTNVDALAFVKEFPQTCSLVVSAMRTARDLYRNLLRRAPDHAVDALLHGRGYSQRSARKRFGTALSNRWLEVSYGVKPLLQDVAGACQTFDSLLTPPDREVTAKAGWPTYETGVSQSGTNTSATQRSSKGNFKIRSSAEVVYRVDNPWDVAFQSLGLDRPLASLWEMIPYSFVVDWFFDVSGWLNSGRSIQGCTFVRGWTTEKIDGRVINMERASGVTAFGRVTTTGRNRQPLSGFPTTIHEGFWDPYFDANRVANAAALMWQGFDRLNSPRKPGA